MDCCEGLASAHLGEPRRGLEPPRIVEHCTLMIHGSETRRGCSEIVSVTRERNLLGESSEGLVTLDRFECLRMELELVAILDLLEVQDVGFEQWHTPRLGFGVEPAGREPAQHVGEVKWCRHLQSSGLFVVGDDDVIRDHTCLPILCSCYHATKQ